MSPNTQKHCFMGVHDILNKYKGLSGIFHPSITAFKIEVQRRYRGISGRAIAGLLGIVTEATGLFSEDTKWMTPFPGVGISQATMIGPFFSSFRRDSLASPSNGTVVIFLCCFPGRWVSTHVPHAVGCPCFTLRLKTESRDMAGLT